MAGASFEYDEVGNTFYYVLVSFYAILLLPATYYFFPSSRIEEVKVEEHECRCPGCGDKRKRKAANKPWRTTIKIVSGVGLVIAWIIFAIIVKKCTEIEQTHEDYDPYQILGIDQGAESKIVKKAYRDLSKVHHPDRGGDPILFDKIAKAYQALTDKDARENWEKYGNPDGPQATKFGIALPKWLVSKEYGLWVLAFYGLIFMIIMPVVVGIWWYNSIKYNTDKVLLDTNRLFFYFVHKTPRMEINRMIYVLSGAFEFCKANNKEIIERPTDEYELPRLLKSLPLLNDKGREQPLSLPYALKARILIHSYLSRMPLESQNGVLDADQRYIIAKLLRLVEEMIIVSQTLTYYRQCKIPIETIENLMRLQPMFVQALWPKNSPLLQLPHITEYNLQFLRKNKIFSCSALASMDADKRRAVLKSLSDAEYRDVLVVLSTMPRLGITTKTVVEGEDDGHELTAGCVITLKVTLTRQSLLDPQEAGLDSHLQEYSEEGISDKEDDEAAEEVDEDEEKEGGNKTSNRKPWEKPRQKKGGAKKKANKNKKKPTTTAAAATATPAEESPAKTAEVVENDEEAAGSGDESGSDKSDAGSDTEENGGADSDSDWESDAPTKKINFESKSVETHRVHCPHYPVDKFEWWWLSLNMTDKRDKQKIQVTAAQLVKTLVDQQTVDLRFAAPQEKGVYQFQLMVKSDSYIDAEYSLEFKLDIKDAKVVEVKYDHLDDDEEEEEKASSEEEYTEGSDSDEE